MIFFSVSHNGAKLFLKFNYDFYASFFSSGVYCFIKLGFYLRLNSEKIRKISCESTIPDVQTFNAKSDLQKTQFLDFEYLAMY